MQRHQINISKICSLHFSFYKISLTRSALTQLSWRQCCRSWTTEPPHRS